MSKVKYINSQLVKALGKVKELSSKENLTEIERDALVQRFEYTVELSWKYMKSFLENEGVPTSSPRDAIRKSVKIGLISSVELWFEYINLRNLASHTYIEENALKIVDKIDDFVNSIENLVKN